MQGVQVPSLVRELRSHLLRGEAQKNPQKALKVKAPETMLLPVLHSPASRSHVSSSFPVSYVSVLYSLWLTELVPPKDVLTPKNLDMYSLMWQEGLCRCN